MKKIREIKIMSILSMIFFTSVCFNYIYGATYDLPNDADTLLENVRNVSLGQATQTIVEDTVTVSAYAYIDQNKESASTLLTAINQDKNMKGTFESLTPGDQAIMLSYVLSSVQVGIDESKSLYDGDVDSTVVHDTTKKALDFSNTSIKQLGLSAKNEELNNVVGDSIQFHQAFTGDKHKELREKLASAGFSSEMLKILFPDGEGSEILNLKNDMVLDPEKKFKDKDGNEINLNWERTGRDHTASNWNQATDAIGNTIGNNSQIQENTKADTTFEQTTGKSIQDYKNKYNIKFNTSDSGEKPEFSLEALTNRVNNLIGAGEHGLSGALRGLLVGDGSIGDIIGNIGRYIMYAAILFFGVKAIWGGVEGKTQFKEVLPFLLAGIAFFFCAGMIINIAASAFSGGQSYQDGNLTGSVNYEKYGEDAFVSVILIVRILAFGGILFTGLKLLFASAEQKADIKSHLIPILVGCIFVFASSLIVDIVVKTFNTTTSYIRNEHKYERAISYKDSSKTKS